MTYINYARSAYTFSQTDHELRSLLTEQLYFVEHIAAKRKFLSFLAGRSEPSLFAYHGIRTIFSCVVSIISYCTTETLSEKTAHIAHANNINSNKPAHCRRLASGFAAHRVQTR